MSIVKKKLRSIFTAISKKKWVYFGILTFVLFVSVTQAARYSDITIWPIMPKYFIKPKNADMLIYNLSVSYIVSYMFYALVNFIPDLVEAIEEQNKSLPFKATIQREVQQFVSCIINLWASIGINASINGKFNTYEVNEIEDFFKLNVIQEISKCVKLIETVGEDIEIDVCNPHLLWITKIKRELDGICAIGNMLLTRYKYDIPSEIFYDMFYILNESGMVGGLLNQINGVLSLRNGRNFSLLTCIGLENNKEANIIQTCQSIINLYYWINNQHDYIVNSTSNRSIMMINKIYIKNFFNNIDKM